MIVLALPDRVRLPTTIIAVFQRYLQRVAVHQTRSSRVVFATYYGWVSRWFLRFSPEIGSACNTPIRKSINYSNRLDIQSYSRVLPVKDGYRKTSVRVHRLPQKPCTTRRYLLRGLPPGTGITRIRVSRSRSSSIVNYCQRVLNYCLFTSRVIRSAHAELYFGRKEVWGGGVSCKIIL